MGEQRRWMKSKKMAAALEDSPATVLLHRAIELAQDAETVTGSWHWTLVQGTQRQEGPKR